MDFLNTISMLRDVLFFTSYMVHLFTLKLFYITQYNFRRAYNILSSSFEFQITHKRTL